MNPDGSRIKSSFFGSVKRKLTSKKSNASNTSNEDASRGSSKAAEAAATQPAHQPRNDAPPPYAESSEAAQAPLIPVPSVRSPSPSGSTASRLTMNSLSTPEDPYAFLSSFDTIFLIDDSSSMTFGTRWQEVSNVLKTIAPICTRHDKDGIDIFFLNHKSDDKGDKGAGKAPGGYCGVTDERAVDRIMTSVSPVGWTPTGSRINSILKPYLKCYEAAVKRCGDPDGTDIKPVNMIIITDGQPSDDPESDIVQVARRLDQLGACPYQVGIQFFQVGDDASASEALRKLDDDLTTCHAGLRDIVDTVTWNTSDGSLQCLTAPAILKTVLGAVTRRLDRQNVDLEAARDGDRDFLRPF